MKNLGFVGLAIAALAVSGCGGGGGSTPAAPTATATPTPAGPTPTPTPTPAPGAMALSYTSAFGASGTAPGTLAFQAQTQTASLTASEPNYAGSFAAVSSCPTLLSVTPATSATGAFTLTALGAVPAGCTISVTGATGVAAATLTATVPTPAGVIMRWYTPNYATQSPPVPISAGPINLIGTGSVFASILAISEQNYIGGFAASNVTTTGCAGFASIAATATPANLPTAAPGTSLAYYTVTGIAAITTAGGCVISASDSYVPVAPATPNPTATIGVSITTSTGTFQ